MLPLTKQLNIGAIMTKYSVSILSILSLLILSACGGEEFSGSFNTQSPLVLKTDQGQYTLPIGTVNVTMTLKESGKVKLTVYTGQGKKSEVVLRLPKESKPKQDGSIAATAAQLKQAFDLSGNRYATREETKPYESSEQCVKGYEDGPQHCEWKDVPETCDASGNNCTGGGRDYVCETTQVPVYGSQDYTAFDVINTTYLNLKFLSPGSNLTISDFSGKMKKVSSVRTRTGYCY